MGRYQRIKSLQGLYGAALLLAVTATARAQAPQLQVNQETGETQEQFAARTKWWREAKFGMFIHWGLYAVPADSTKGLGEWYMYNNQVHLKSV